MEGQPDKIVCHLRLPNRLLSQWHKDVGGGQSTYLQLLNDAIVDQVVTVNIHCERLERRLAHRAGTIKASALKLSGGAQMKMLDENSSSF